MKIIVQAKPSAKTAFVELLTQPTLNLERVALETKVYKVAVKESPDHGKANSAIIKILAEYFRIPQSAVKLVSGRGSKKKIFEIADRD